MFCDMSRRQQQFFMGFRVPTIRQLSVIVIFWNSTFCFFHSTLLYSQVSSATTLPDPPFNTLEKFVRRQVNITKMRLGSHRQYSNCIFKLKDNVHNFLFLLFWISYFLKFKVHVPISLWNYIWLSLNARWIVFYEWSGSIV